MGRLVPFSVFIIVPAGELFLPIALKVFPNLLPSTYEDQKAKDLKSSKLRSTRRDVSDFLRKTLRESGIPLSAKTRQREEFTQFFKKVVKLEETLFYEYLLIIYRSDQAASPPAMKMSSKSARSLGTISPWTIFQGPSWSECADT